MQLQSCPRAACAAILLLLATPGAASAAFGDRTLRRGDSGHDVRVLQSWLSHVGYATPVDGAFGARTLRSVKRFERAEGRPRNGVFSTYEARLLRKRLRESGAAERSSRRSRARTRYSFGERTLRRGHRGHDVRVLQSWLSHTGIRTQVDGVFGSGTERNVRAFETREDRRADGVVGRSDARLLRQRMREAVAGQGSGNAQSTGDHVFPVRGRHDYGGSGARFGAGRSGHSHQGQDVFAACGTRLVAAQGGRVVYAGYHSAAGNYVVIRGAESREDYVYMHLRERVSLARGAQVETGEQIGTVGETGNAHGCHLHFELWTAPGWYDGGAPYDPLRKLRAWDAAS